MDHQPIVVLGLGEAAGHWAQALSHNGHRSVLADPFTFVPPAPSHGPRPIKLVVIDSALDVAPNILQATRANGIPAVLATSAGVPQNPNRDPLTHYGTWLADAYIGSAEELVHAIPIVLDTQTDPNGQALHLTYRGSIPPMEVAFPIGTAFPLHEGASCFLGRSRTSTIMLGSPHVGRSHALIAAVPGGERRCAVMDLQSHNGTYVKGRRVGGDVISPGDEVAIAGYRFVLECLPSYSA